MIELRENFISPIIIHIRLSKEYAEMEGNRYVYYRNGNKCLTENLLISVAIRPDRFVSLLENAEIFKGTKGIVQISMND